LTNEEEKKKPEPCPHCGQLVGAEGPHRTFTRVVRPRMRFGPNKGGESVEICERDIDRRATVMGTMAVDEWEALVRKRAQPREPVSSGPSSREMAAGFFERMREEAAADKERHATEKSEPGRKRV
jgi:hypothetical protein